MRAGPEIDASGTTINHHTVGSSLLARGKLDEVGGVAYLMELQDNSSATLRYDEYAAIIRELAQQRAYIKLGEELISSIRKKRFIYPEESASLLERGLLRIGQNAPSRFISQEQAGTLAFAAMDERRAKSDGECVNWIPVPWIELQELMPVLEPGLRVVAARPSVGKTAFVVNLLVAAAADKHYGLFFSLEQSPAEIFERMWCLISGVRSHFLRTPRLAEDSFE